MDIGRRMTRDLYMYICICACVFVSVCVCVCINIHARVYTYRLKRIGGCYRWGVGKRGKMVMHVYDDSIKRFDCSSRDDCPLIENILDSGWRVRKGEAKGELIPYISSPYARGSLRMYVLQLSSFLIYRLWTTVRRGHALTIVKGASLISYLYVVDTHVRGWKKGERRGWLVWITFRRENVTIILRPYFISFFLLPIFLFSFWIRRASENWL